MDQLDIEVGNCKTEPKFSDHDSMNTIYFVEGASRPRIKEETQDSEDDHFEVKHEPLDRECAPEGGAKEEVCNLGAGNIAIKKEPLTANVRNDAADSNSEELDLQRSYEEKLIKSEKNIPGEASTGDSNSGGNLRPIKVEEGVTVSDNARHFSEEDQKKANLHSCFGSVEDKHPEEDIFVKIEGISCLDHPGISSQDNQATRPICHPVIAQDCTEQLDHNMDPKADLPPGETFKSEDREQESSWTSEIDLEIHEKRKPFKCPGCGKRYSRNYSLLRHQRAHTIEPYKCTDCGKGFSYRSHLDVHKRIHGVVKPYQCQECGVKFTQTSNLNTHKKSHTMEKPYKCKVCGKSFPFGSQFAIHLRTHTGDKPFQCGCGRKFARNGSLMRHRRNCRLPT